jgi:hypothetical protein
MTTENTTAENTKEKFKGLTNEEIMVIYYRLKRVVDDQDEDLEKNRITRRIDTPIGMANATTIVPEKHIQLFKETQYYKLPKEVIAKLEPIVTLMVEMNDELAKLSEELK